MDTAYRAGTVSAQAFSEFYVSTLADRSAEEWEPLRQAFVHDVIAPRIPRAARRLVRSHLVAGDLVVLTTATNRFIAEPTAARLSIKNVIATECELDAFGRFSGRPSGTLNMREGKVTRLHDWLAERGAGARRLRQHGLQRFDQRLAAFCVR